MNDGEISNNVGFMGGVFVGERFQPDYKSTATFTMNDGTISGNKAGYCGGGVAIWTSGSFYMKGGTISDNTAGRQGGGVYVGSTPYVLHMKDVLVTDNTASILGGGMWLCPTGDAHTSVSNGALISGNSATSADGATAGDDIASVPQEGRTATITLADRALGGGAANWYDDGAVARDDENRTLTVSISNAPKAAAPVDVQITAHKVLEGATLADGQFSFELADESDTVVATATNDEEGVVAFDALTFDTAGDYAYQVREVASGVEGVTYDSTVHNVAST